jgi:rubrerythrin
VAFDNPVEQFLNKILSDAKRQSIVETQFVEDKGEILDAMYETMESSNDTLAHVKDVMCNVRTEVKEIQPLMENIQMMRVEISGLKKEVKRLEEKIEFPNICPACGKPLLPELKVCPFCGENTRFVPREMISTSEYR